MVTVDIGDDLSCSKFTVRDYLRLIYLIPPPPTFHDVMRVPSCIVFFVLRCLKEVFFVLGHVESQVYAFVGQILLSTGTYNDPFPVSRAPYIVDCIRRLRTHGGGLKVSTLSTVAVRHFDRNSSSSR